MTTETPEQILALAHEVIAGRSRSYVVASKTLATHLAPILARLIAAENEAAHLRGVWDLQCTAVAEMCVIAGAPSEAPPDVWTLHKAICRLLARVPA